MSNKILQNCVPHEIMYRTVQFYQAKRNFLSYYYTVALVPASIYRLCNPFLREIDKFLNKVHRYILALLILLNFPKIQLSILSSILFRFWNEENLIFFFLPNAIKSCNLQFLGDVFGGRCINFINITNCDGRKWNIPNWIIVCFDGCYSWCCLKPIPYQTHQYNGENSSHYTSARPNN